MLLRIYVKFVIVLQHYKILIRLETKYLLRKSQTLHSLLFLVMSFPWILLFCQFRDRNILKVLQRNTEIVSYWSVRHCYNCYRLFQFVELIIVLIPRTEVLNSSMRILFVFIFWYSIRVTSWQSNTTTLKYIFVHAKYNALFFYRYKNLGIHIQQTNTYNNFEVPKGLQQDMIVINIFMTILFLSSRDWWSIISSKHVGLIGYGKKIFMFLWRVHNNAHRNNFMFLWSTRLAHIQNLNFRWIIYIHIYDLCNSMDEITKEDEERFLMGTHFLLYNSNIFFIHLGLGSYKFSQ